MIERSRALLYNVLRQTLSQETRNRIKLGVVRARRRLAPVYRARYGTFGASELAAELSRRLPADAEIVMVHCSLNDLQPMYRGTVRELLDALIELCGTERTLAMPAFFFGGPAGDPVEYYRNRPVFDARRHPSEMGLLSELFRRSRNVKRSLHPTASVCARGPLADEITNGHHLAATTFGTGTPFGVMAHRRTAILGIGIDYFRCLSQVHAAEDLLNERYPLRLRPGRLTIELRDVDGATHLYELQIAVQAFARRLERLEQLVSAEELVRWRFHGAPMFMTTAARVTDVLTDAALRGETIYDALPIRRRASARAAP